MFNKFILYSKGIIILEKKNSINKSKYVDFILKNIKQFGITFNEDLIDVLNTYDDCEAEQFYKEFSAFIIQKLRTDIFHQPMYPGFPKQVFEERIENLVFNALIHYMSFGIIKPFYEREYIARFKQDCKNRNKLKVISLGTIEDAERVFVNLASANTSISDEDKEVIKYFIESYKDKAINLLPQVIPIKENAAYIASIIMKNIVPYENIVKKYIKTSTDVLRLAAALSEGDISLGKVSRFISFKRSERKLMLSIIDADNNNEENMIKYKNEFIRLGEKLHPGEYKKKFNKAYEVFYKLRNNIKIETFNGALESAVKDNNIEYAVKMLKSRPGIFARNLDRLLRKSSNCQFILDNFRECAQEVSSSVLLVVRDHFLNRLEQEDLRTFFIKGKVCKLYAKDNDCENIDYDICMKAAEICSEALENIYKERKSLGRVYIDEKLKNYKVPFAQRSASKALKTVARGSRMKIDGYGDTIRFFLYWKEPKNERVDIDLSAVIYDEKWSKVFEIAYYNLRNKKLNCVHSGDITAAPHGASEFIDIDMKRVREAGGRYVVFAINAFTNTKFCDMPQCFTGWMMREYPDSGEIYDPCAVENKIDISSDTTICIPVIADVFNHEIIWCDIALENMGILNNVKQNNPGIISMGKALTNLKKPNLYDLFYLNAKARGNIVWEKEDADIIFSLEEGITPFDSDEIISNYL